MSGSPYIRIIRPDFKHSTIIQDNRSTLVFPTAGTIEVKAIQNPITLKTSSYQIEAEIWECHYSLTAYGIGKAGKYKAGAFTIVTPYLNRNVGDDVKKFAEKKGVNMYESYAFRSKCTGKVVFSIPERLNNVRQNLELPYLPPGNIDGVS